MAPTQSTKNFQAADIRKFLVVVRYKPAPAPSSDLGFIDEASNAVDTVKKDVNKAVSGIPGLKMFIKEEKKESTSEKEYAYNYSEWDTWIKKTDSNLKELYKGSKAELFEFSATDFEDRKKEGEALFNKINDMLSSCQKYQAQLFFVGIGQGGNVVNECLHLLASDATFNSEKWHVQNVVYVATPLYKEHHLQNLTPLKSKGQVLSVTNSFDLTHRLVDYIHGKDSLLKCIAEVNKSLLTFHVGMIQMEIMNLIQGVVRVIKDFMDLHVGSGTKKGQSLDDKINRAKDELTAQEDALSACIKSLLNVKDPILEDLQAMLDTKSLKQFEEAFRGFEQIPQATAAAFISDVTKKASEIANRAAKKASDEVTYQAQRVIDENINSHTGGGSSAQRKKEEKIFEVKDLAILFHCLHVPLQTILLALRKIGANTPAGDEVAIALIKRTGVTEFYMPHAPGGSNIDISRQDPYNKKMIERYQNEEKIDKVKQFINTISDNLVTVASQKVTNLAADLSKDKKAHEAQIKAADMLSTLIRPMLTSKERVMGEILSWLKEKDLTKLLDDDFFSKIGLKPLELFSNGDFKNELKWYEDDIKLIEGELNRLKDFFNRIHYDLMDDTLYFIYNSHNLVIQHPALELLNTMDKNMGIYEHKLSKGMLCSYPDGNDYNAKGEKEKEHVKPVEALTETQSQ